MCEQIVTAISMRLSLDAAAAEIGTSPGSAYQWQCDIPEFAQAIEMGRAWALLVWEGRCWRSRMARQRPDHLSCPAGPFPERQP